MLEFSQFASWFHLDVNVLHLYGKWPEKTAWKMKAFLLPPDVQQGASPNKNQGMLPV